MLLLVPMLAACTTGTGSQDAARQFATDLPTATAPVPILSTPTPTVLREVTASTTPEGSPQPSGEWALEHAVTTLYSFTEGAVIAIDLVEGTTRVITRTDRTGEIVRIASSPDGSRLALLRSRPDPSPGKLGVEIWSGHGRQLQHWDDPEGVLNAPPGPELGKALLDWSGDGTRLAVAFPHGGMVILSMIDNRVVRLLDRDHVMGPVALDWSPDGAVIAFATRSDDAAGAALWFAAVETVPIDPVQIAGTGGDRPVRGIWWRADSSAVLMIQGRPNTATNVGGDLVEVNRRTLRLTTLLGASRFGPTSAIVSLAPSPDLVSTGLAVATSDGYGGFVVTVWLLDRGDHLVRVNLPVNAQIAAINWTRSGFAVSVIEPDRAAVLLFGPNGEPIPERPAIIASPMATPLASPIAAASPGSATPLASPAATPAN